VTIFHQAPASDVVDASTEAGNPVGLTTHVALIATTGNQTYIYATSNRLGCNIGASGLLRAATVEWVEAAINELPSPPGAQLIGASSGFTLLTGDETSLRSVVRSVTLRALKDAPGLAVAGAIAQRQGLSDTIRALAEQSTRLGNRPGGSTARFQRIPIVAGCGSSPFPAEHSDERLGLLSEIAYRQYEYRKNSLTKLGKQLSERLRLHRNPSADDARPEQNADPAGQQEVFVFPENLDQLEHLARRSSGARVSGSDSVGWIAVVHADGNGVGAQFLGLAGRVEKQTHDVHEAWGKYQLAYQRFSSELTAATETAAALALASVTPAGGTTPVIPLLVEGDDLTFVMDATVALRFTRKLLEEFEELSKDAAGALSEEFLNDLDLQALTTSGLTMKAGIAIVKPHYPFHAAYELSEQLMGNAKKGVLALRGRDPLPPSAIDFHMLADSSGADLDRIRSTRVDDQCNRLFAGPFLLRDRDDRDDAGVWSVNDLEEGINAFGAVDPSTGRRRVSASSVGEIRQQRFVSDAAAGAVLTRIGGLQLGKLQTDDVVGLKAKPTLIVDLADVAGLWGPS
jgi:hypothetical protein